VALDHFCDTLDIRSLKEGGARGVAEEAQAAPGGGDADEEMPQAVPPPPRTHGKRITRLEEEVHDMRKDLAESKEIDNVGGESTI
ncbi:hypothetical protein Tco_0878176, partial [Tanacetum coccineum]